MGRGRAWGVIQVAWCVRAIAWLRKGGLFGFVVVGFGEALFLEFGCGGEIGLDGGIMDVGEHDGVVDIVNDEMRGEGVMDFLFGDAAGAAWAVFFVGEAEHEVVAMVFENLGELVSENGAFIVG